MSPEVTVVIPAYNAGEFITDAIYSVQIQDYPCHIVVVDDGSTDRTVELAHQQKASVISLSENKGAANALNVGINAIDSDYVCWLSADDCYLTRDKVSRQVKAMEETGADFSYYRSMRMGKSLRDSEAITPFSDVIMPYFPLAGVWLHNPINGSSVMLRRSSIAKYGLFDPKLRNHDADGEMWMRWLKHGAKLVGLEGTAVFYRVHNGQSSKNRMEQAKFEAINRVKVLFD